MSQAELDIVLEGFKLLEAEDFEGLDRVWHPDGRVTAPEGWPEPGPFEGRDAVIAQFRRLVSEMGEHHFKDIELVSDSDGWIVLTFIWDVRGAGSGASIASKLAGAYRLEDGKVIEVHFGWSPEEARSAAGLS